jgi:hypothetical protein
MVAKADIGLAIIAHSPGNCFKLVRFGVVAGPAAAVIIPPGWRGPRT